MRNRRAGAVLLLLVAVTAGQIGCSLILGLKDRTDIGTGGGGGGGGEGDGGPPGACIPRDSSAPIDDACGIFVSSSLGVDGEGASSKAHPFKTLAAATLAAGKAKKPVYACAETFTEALKVTSEVAIYGGLDCKKAWAYDGTTKSRLTALPDDIPLTLTQAATSVQLFDFTVQARDAMLDGGSSIALLANQVMASFTRCDLGAGNGKKGLDGTPPTESVGPNISSDPAIRGNDGVNACASTTKSLGGTYKDNMFCPTSASNFGPVGGDGGDGEQATGDDGYSTTATPYTAQGGKGQMVDNPTWDCVSYLGYGTSGKSGMPGKDGAGATGVNSLGIIGASGYTGVVGGEGMPGQPGQGGGGGGGAKGKTACAGASGGGGGAGGCGGHGGTGGKAGGTSIALMSLGASLSFEYVNVMLGSGGAGGDGSEAQGGGSGGMQGYAGMGDPTAPYTSGACDGGHGGRGGDGGHGGGGRGGHAIGIAATGTEMPDTKGITFLKKGTPGPGGKGGPMNDGDPGVQANVQLFP
jgi:hypothetical protein